MAAGAGVAAILEGRRVILLSCADITKQKQAEAELQTRNSEYEIIVRQTGKSFVRYDLRSGETVAFRSDSFGIAENVAEDYPEQRVLSGRVAPESAEAYLGFFNAIRRREPQGSCDVRFIAPDGGSHWEHADYTLIYDADSKPTHAVIAYYDSTEERLEKEHLVSAAQRDAVTGLYNRAAAEEKMRAILDADTGERCALLMLDLDNLKGINDTLGHAEGDRAIRLIAETMSLHFRDADILGRAGGDEFIALLTNISSAATLRGTMASFIRRLNENRLGKNADYPFHCSMGVTFGIAGQDGFDGLFRQADRALYHVKRNGKNDFAFYMPDMENEDYTYAPHAGITLSRTEWYEAEEFKRLTTALTSFFPLIVSANLSNNSYYMMEYATYATHKSKDAGVYDELIESGASTFHPDERQSFIDCFSREAMFRAYAEGRASVIHEGRQLGDDGVYRWMKTVVVFVPDEANGDLRHIAMAHVMEEEKQNELERMRLMKLLEFTVSRSFEYICLVHTDTGKYELYDNDGNNTHTIPTTGNFNEVTVDIMERHVAPEEWEIYLENALIGNVIRHMENTDGTYSYRYRLEDGEREAAFAWYEPTHTELLMTVRKL